MFDSTETRHAVLTMAGGTLSSVVLALDDVAPEFVGLAVVVPVLLGFGVLETHARYGEQYGPVGRAGVALTGSGLALLLVAILLLAVVQPGFPGASFLVVVPGGPGVVALALGSAFLAAALYRLGAVDAPAAVLLGLGVPLAAPVGALLATLAGPGGLVAVVPAGVAPGFSGAPYGLGWVLVGRRLRETVGEDRGAELDERPPTVGVSPQVVAAGLVGAAFVLLGAARFLPPLSGSPWTTGNPALDGAHLVVGVAGLAAAGRGDARPARTYNRVVGPVALSLSVVAPAVLGVSLTEVLVRLPGAVVLAVVGFGSGGGTNTEDATRPASE